MEFQMGVDNSSDLWRWKVGVSLRGKSLDNERDLQYGRWTNVPAKSAI